MDDQSSGITSKMISRLRAKREVGSFVKKMHFENYVRSGMTPTQAAGRVGIRIPPGRELRIQDVLNFLETGKFGRKI